MIYIEIIFCLLTVSIQISELVSQNFIRYSTCYVTLGYNETECARLGTKYSDNRTAELEKATDPHVTVLHMYKDIMEAFVSTCMCLFLGAWSDKYGRRPVLICALAGYAMSYILTTVVVSTPNTSPWFLLLSALPGCLVGGLPIILSSTVCYIVDTTTPENKGVRLGIFEASFTLIGMLGTSLSAYAFRALGYTAVYLISTVGILITLLIMVATVSESITNPQPIQGCAVKEVFKFSLIKETATTTFKKRNDNDRAMLLLVTSVIIIYFLAVLSDDKIVMLYVSTKLHWSLEHYSLFVTARKFAWVAGSLVGVLILHKLLRIREGFLIFLGMVSMMLSALFQGIANKDWHMYLSGGSRCFGGVLSPMTRSVVSKVVPTEDAGKVFSFIVICETLVGFIGRPIYAYIYNHTLKTVPGTFNFVTVGIYVVEMVLAVVVIVLQIRQQEAQVSHEYLTNEEIYDSDG